MLNAPQNINLMRGLMRKPFELEEAELGALLPPSLALSWESPRPSE